MTVQDAQSLGLTTAPGEVLFVALTGSHAYGLAHEYSDVDFRGVYACSAAQMLSLRPPRETVDRKHPDVTLHELRKFCKLAAAANPTVLETLWAPVVVTNPLGDALRNNRRMFLSQRARNTYAGYARQQIEKARRGTGGSRGVRHLQREKFVLHTLRLAEAGLHLFVNQEVMVRVPEPELLRERAMLWQVDLDSAERHLEGLIKRIDAMAENGALPEEPDYEAIDETMAWIRGAL